MTILAHRTHWDGCETSHLDCALAVLAKTRAELAAALPDALRYRWLRERPSLILWDAWPHDIGDAFITPEFMDAAIDAARKEGK